ncbi:MAG: dihydrofolate reductase [Kordiimonadaceae bacterium]|jgi:dihydrofolate reductase|nr:dihydrofolate reductase [Kordiimonadaceae bacterium]MBT6031231.1 dihydrofolate reductase [Kordiimonadaceae bacterium]
MKNIVYCAMSLDGYIADKDGGVAFLDSIEHPPEADDYGYTEFMDSIDALVMGRNTYDTVMGFGVDWPYGDKTVVVVTHHDIKISDDIKGSVSSFAGSPQEIIQHLKAMGKVNLYIDGGKIIQEFLNENLIDQLIISVVPILIGEGIPLFGPLNKDLKLITESSNQYKNGLLQLKYNVVK